MFAAAGQSLSTVTKTYGGLAAAAKALGYASSHDLQTEGVGGFLDVIQSGPRWGKGAYCREACSRFKSARRRH